MWMKTWLRLRRQREHLSQQVQQHENATSEIIAGMNETTRSIQEVIRNSVELSFPPFGVRCAPRLRGDYSVQLKDI